MKPIGINSFDDIEEFFNMVEYKACEYNFLTLYMWQSVYDFHYLKKDKFMLIFGYKDGSIFVKQPYCKEENLKEAFEEIFRFFGRINQKVCIRAVTSGILDKINSIYPDKFDIETSRDDSDYIYDAEKLRTLSGRSMHSKKNHWNYFLKEFGDRYVYKALTKKDFDECMDLAEKWAFSREKDQNLIGESLAIKKVLKNYAKLKNFKIGGIYIDNRLEAFSYGDLLNNDTALVHIEKANPNIRGLYVAINKLFLQNEFESVNYVNREDDLGIDGLRQAKLSYKPIELVDKYTLIER